MTNKHSKIEDRFHIHLFPQFKYMTFIYSQPFKHGKVTTIQNN